MVASSAPHRPLQEQDLHVIEVFARSRRLALERSERLADEAGRAQEERMLNHASGGQPPRSSSRRSTARSSRRPRELTGAPKVMLRRFEPAAELRDGRRASASPTASRARGSRSARG